LLREVLEECGAPEWRDTAELALSELATNAVLHAHTGFTVRVQCSASHVRVEVEDESSAIPQQRAYGSSATTGRGLALVAALTMDHGYSRTPTGKVVWFCLSADQAAGQDGDDLDVDQLLAAWGDDVQGDSAASGAGATGVAKLMGFPPTLWLAAVELHDGLLRELALFRAGRGLDTSDLGRADHARFVIGEALMRVLTDERIVARARNPLPTGHPSHLEDVPATVDLEVSLWSEAAADLAVLQDVLDEANRRAAREELLMPPALPEVVALRDWVAEQIISAVAGQSPMPWRGADADHFAQQFDGAVRQLDYDVDAVVNGPRTAVCVDAQNRILGISAALAAEIGWRVEDLVGRRVVAIVPPRFREAHVAGLTRHLSTGQAHALRVELQLPVLRADGSEVLCDFWIDADRTPRGQRVYIAYVSPVREQGDEGAVAPQPLDYVGLFRQLPTSYMVMDRDLRFVEANDAYLATTGRTRAELMGEYVFDAFPPAPDALGEDGISFVQRSFERARDTGVVDAMPLQKYAIADGDGRMSERWWSLISVPIRDKDGSVVLVAQRAEDVTDWVQERASGAAERERTEQLSRRVHEVEADLYARARELEAALAAQAASAARLGSLASVAIELTGAETVDDLSRIVFASGLPVLGADGGAIGVRDDDAVMLRLTASESLGKDVRLAYGEIPLSSRLPATHVARTGETVLLPTRESGLAWSPDIADFYEMTRRHAWATLPLRVGDQLLGALVASWAGERDFAREDLELMEGFAAQVSVALQRIQATEAERRAAGAAARLSESLQRSLLTEPPQPEGLRIAVRYQPAALEAQVGGDWYDAFITQGDAALVVVGDVAGHDRDAAAAMAQIRNLLRGIAYESFDNPATLLGRLDRAVQGLGIDALATALLARIERQGQGWQLRWSNAGHPPPVLRLPDGRVTVLDDEPDLLVGFDEHAARTDRLTAFPRGSLLVLYTDGLVEGRRVPLDSGVARIVEVIASSTDPEPESLADAVLAVADPTNEDDIAVLVLGAD
jgi:PAS domain S-box-containing protein